ncbi:hypothetical protein [Ignicoccus hospitalis]|uniref:Uncharacterized protein n=1 Tax=Ignicoccus hospitalis (strain KIN4/I / DSM 18386 / JCM 14125) TaxID=453591 RepID=A8A8F9_IGNH4|nr:hypothetical protein [Ignicoccus hospitalis]ABU81211.1 hypothetical protein Igni_0027 [Ignicoccus hospitalis KIN4/I]HIH90641.1 hypothetical protein [Desulfurococcaceae archaeon]
MKPDFLRQIFNVVLASHLLDERTTKEARKLVWAAENKYKFSSFDNPDPTENLKKYLESSDFDEVLRLLKRKKEVVEDLVTAIETYYGTQLAEIVRRKLAELTQEGSESSS